MDTPSKGSAVGFLDFVEPKAPAGNAVGNVLLQKRVFTSNVGCSIFFFFFFFFFFFSKKRAKHLFAPSLVCVLWLFLTRLAVGPKTGFLDMIDDDEAEALAQEKAEEDKWIKESVASLTKSAPLLENLVTCMQSVKDAWHIYMQALTVLFSDSQSSATLIRFLIDSEGPLVLLFFILFFSFSSCIFFLRVFCVFLKKNFFSSSSSKHGQASDSVSRGLCAHSRRADDVA